MAGQSRTSRLTHLPALDGLRGVAVAAVLLFHAGFSWAKGGFLGVSIFFTLSGFLITSLLLREWGSDRRIDLRTFWARRFRRLMPAALATLAAVSVLAWAIGTHEQLHTLRLDVWAAVAYVANWRFLYAGRSYADLWSAPSPVQHFWSLAVEEQFYLLYPLATFAALRLGGRRLLTAVLGLGTAASVAWAVHLRGHLDRVYYGTDTRMAELLVGGLLAVWWTQSASAPDAPATRRGRAAVLALGVAGLAGSAVLWPLVGQTSTFVTRGLLPLQAALSVAAIAAAVRPGPVASLLSWRPLATLGLVSYGVYLYHWPIFLALTPGRTHLSQVPLFFLRIAVTGMVAWASYIWLEQPIRRRRVLVTWRIFPAAASAVTTVAVAAAVVTLSVPASTVAYADVQLAGHSPTVQHLSAAASAPAVASAPAPAAGPASPAGPVPVTASPPLVAASSSPTATVAPGPVPSSIMIIGDSGMFDVSEAISALYAHLGTGTVVNASWPGWSFTRDPAGWQRDWPALVAQNHPQLVFVMMGGWDWSYVQAHGVDAYEGVLATAARILQSGGARILWLGEPPGGNARPDQIDPLYQRFAASHPGNAYADPAPVLRAIDGSAPRWLPAADGHLQLLRKPDQWHFCQDGAVRVAYVASSAVAGLGWAANPVGGWEQGAWRADHRYNDPPGGCDPTRPGNAPPH
ncbi:MAG TPA: acyltransferase family protein [Acidimicrobiales bacterium]|nr:acyltransferase family protein [Acidimicrobiales bacterium]